MLAAKAATDGAHVNLISAHYEEDAEMTPDDFIKTEPMARQMGDHQDFKKHRKLPILDEILSKLEVAPADYYIYSNVDIALQPSFYNFVLSQINKGYDAFVINRRTVSKSWTSTDEYELMCLDKGEKHPGFDCFIFKKELFSKFDLGNAGLGANWIGRVLITNLITYASKFKIFEDEHQTFHIGDDRSWKNPDYADYDEFNRQELINLLLRTRENQGLNTDQLAYINEFLYKDMKWNGDGANPYMQPKMDYQPTLIQRVKNRIKRVLQ